jgi:hypothetical protein
LGQIVIMNRVGKMNLGDPRGQIDRFRARVIGARDLQERLSRIDDDQTFAAQAVDAGRRAGFRFDVEDVRATMQAAWRPEADRASSSLRQPPSNGWLPVRTHEKNGILSLDWAYFGENRLHEPFYEQSVQRCLHKPFNRLFRCTTPFASLEGWLERQQSLPPSGFIFHMSRCGSTLAAQMLVALADTIVVSEAEPLDAIVRAGEERSGLGEEEHAAWLTWIVGAFGQARRAQDRRFFLKLDSWHTLFLPLFRRAFPSVPWVFLYRDPVEILVSQLRQPGLQMVPGRLAPTLDVDQSGGRENYCARVLAKICEPVLRHGSDSGGLLINYRDLPAVLWTTIMPHFGLECSEADRAAMMRIAQHNAKTPSLPFSPDSEAKQRIATQAARGAADEWIGDIYRQLERLRLEKLRRIARTHESDSI